MPVGGVMAVALTCQGAAKPAGGGGMMMENLLYRIKEHWTLLVVLVFGILLLVAQLLPKRKPKDKFFTCTRCRRREEHNLRTINAWREGKTRLFCQACHQAWLVTQPRSPKASRAGCASVIVAVLVVVTLLVA